MKKYRIVAAALATACLVILQASIAVGQTPGLSLEALLNGQTITADDKLFANWELLQAETDGAGILNLAGIQVTPLAGDPLNPGIKFTSPVGTLGTPFGHPGGAAVRLRFKFTVETTTGEALIKDNSLLLNDFVFDAGPNASIRISETITDAAGNSLGDKSVFAESTDQPNSGDPDHFDEADFPVQSMVMVEKFIDIRGPGQNDGAFLTMFEQRFSQIPEPSALGSFLLLMTASAVPRWWWRHP